MNKKTFVHETAGRPITFEFGKLAGLAQGSVTMQWGETVILATACASPEPREGLDFLPFRVDFEERQYAIGRIPGSFFRREGKPSDEATLAMRLIDRPLRPLFPKGYHHDVQVVITVLSYDPDCPSDVLGIIGASMALNVSDIPLTTPVGAVRVGLVDEALVINPDHEQMKNSRLDLIVAGSEEAVLMVEAGAHEVPEETVLEAIFVGHEEIKKMAAFQREVVEEIGLDSETKTLRTIPSEIEESVRRVAQDKVKEALSVNGKADRHEAKDEVRQAVHEELDETFPEGVEEIDKVLSQLEREEMRNAILSENRRIDGRRTDEIRPISCEVGFLPRVHGSGLFNRGETQVLTVAALGTVSDRQMIDSMSFMGSEFKRYFHHYNFPPYSTGEARFMRMPSRREIGHGALAERAILPILPSEDDFPYTMRLVSEVLASNGSTSMASVCASSLALMDAGVNIKNPVSGIAMGLIKEGDQFAVLSDIMGIEDHLGDMDFKVAGTAEGVTAVQMDMKVPGVTKEILQIALEQARDGRQHILNCMLSVIPKPRTEMSQRAPRMVTLKVNPSKIRYIIGPGGKMINSIIDDYGVQVDVEDDGTVYVFSENAEGIEGAMDRIKQLTADVEVGQIYRGKVKRIIDKLGAFVEILPNQEGLVHISKLDTEYVSAPSDLLSVGDEIMVKLTEVDKMDRLNLSREAVIKELGREEVEKQEKRG